MECFISSVVTVQEFILEKYSFIEGKSIDSLECPIVMNASPSRVNSMIFFFSRISISEINFPFLGNSFTSGFKQLIIQFSIRLEACVKIMLQMIVLNKTVIKMDSETFKSVLEINPFVTYQRKQYI